MCLHILCITAIHRSYDWLRIVNLSHRCFPLLLPYWGSRDCIWRRCFIAPPISLWRTVSAVMIIIIIAPLVQFYLASYFRSEGKFVQGSRLTDATITVDLPQGTTACDIGAITIWCRRFQVFFGTIEIPDSVFVSKIHKTCPGTMVCMFLHLSYIPQCCGILILSGKIFDILLVIKCMSFAGGFL